MKTIIMSNPLDNPLSDESLRELEAEVAARPIPTVSPDSIETIKALPKDSALIVVKMVPGTSSSIAQAVNYSIQEARRKISDLPPIVLINGPLEEILSVSEKQMNALGWYKKEPG